MSVVHDVVTEFHCARVEAEILEVACLKAAANNRGVTLPDAPALDGLLEGIEGRLEGLRHQNRPCARSSRPPKSRDRLWDRPPIDTNGVRCEPIQGACHLSSDVLAGSIE